MTGKRLACLAPACLALMFIAVAVAVAGPGEQATPPTVAEARQRARLLHGAIHDTLQVVHARYFREGEKLAIPAASLDLVFREMEGRDGVKLRWLVVDGKAMNVDNEPQDDFEKAAIKDLKAGKASEEKIVTKNGKSYLRVATAIPVVMEKCTMCHENYKNVPKGQAIGALGYEIEIR